MANGDIATLAGLSLVASGDDARLGYDQMNRLLDEIAKRTGSPGAVAWSLAGASVQTGFGTLTDAAGASTGTLVGGWKAAGGLAYLSFELTYTGATLTGSSSGNIADTAAIILPAVVRPAGPRWFNFYAKGNAQGSAVVYPGGTVNITNIFPNYAITSGTVLRFEAVYPL